MGRDQRNLTTYKAYRPETKGRANPLQLDEFRMSEGAKSTLLPQLQRLMNNFLTPKDNINSAAGHNHSTRAPMPGR